jgi:cell division protein FtsN
VGAFTVRDSADKLAAELQKSGYDVFVVSAEVGGKKYYRVRVKAGKTKQEAQKIAGKLSSEGYPTFIAYEK